MIVDKILADYTARARARKPRSGLPTGSAFGTCAAQLEMLRHPRFTTPEPLTARRLMVFEDGDVREQWWLEQIQRHHPGRHGLAQQPFYFRIPMEPADLAVIRAKMATRDFWGIERPGFRPPQVHVGDDHRVKIRVPADRKLGFVLDPAPLEDGDGQPAVWAPTYVDRILYDPDLPPDLALHVLEKKALSDFGFHRVVAADPGYGMRAQIAGQAAATGLPAVLLAYRKDAAHMAELIYRQSQERIRVDLIRPNGTRETFFTARPGATLTLEDGSPATLPHADEWEVAEVWSPFDPALLAAIRRRVRTVLLHDPRPEDLKPGTPGWDREYGPEFVCSKCRATGKRTCPTCKGTGQTATGKVCGKDSKAPGVKTCQGAKTVMCQACEGVGQREEAELPRFPCGYCPVRAFCWPMARLDFEAGDLTAKPRWYVKRADVEAAGITWVPAEPEPEITPVLVDITTPPAQRAEEETAEQLPL